MRYGYVLLGALLFAGCGKSGEPEQPKGHVIARVDNSALTLEEIRSAYGEAEWNQLSPQEQREQVQNWVNLTILAKEADNLDLAKDPGMQLRIETAEKKIKANTLMSKKFSVAEPTDAEIQVWYQAHTDQFVSPDTQYKIQRVFTRSRPRAEQALNEFRSGTGFREVAISYSEEAGGRNGGFMGFQTAADYSPEAWKTIISLEQNQAEIVPIDTGYYVIRWYEKQSATAVTKSFDEVKGEIRTRLIQEKKEAMLDSLLDKLKTKSEIEITL
jgi:hypothetical protein